MLWLIGIAKPNDWEDRTLTGKAIYAVLWFVTMSLIASVAHSVARLAWTLLFDWLWPVQ